MLRDTNRLHGETLWVNALCINQSDLVERGRQVKRMGGIFGGPSRVMVWIGPAADGSEKVAELVDLLWTSMKGTRRRLSEEQILSALPPGPD